MTSSETDRRRAETVLSKIEAALDETVLCRTIDQVIDNALIACGEAWRPPWRPREIHQAVGNLLRLADPAPPLTGSRFDLQADQAADLIHAHYQGIHERGMDGLMLDLVLGQKSAPSVESDLYVALQQIGVRFPGDTDEILSQISQILKTLRRQRYTDWVVRRHVDPLDESLQVALVELLTDAHGQVRLSPELRWHPLELIGELPELIATHLERIRLEQQLLSRGSDSG